MEYQTLIIIVVAVFCLVVFAPKYLCGLVVIDETNLE